MTVYDYDYDYSTFCWECVQICPYKQKFNIEIITTVLGRDVNIVFHRVENVSVRDYRPTSDQYIRSIYWPSLTF